MRVYKKAPRGTAIPTRGIKKNITYMITEKSRKGKGENE